MTSQYTDAVTDWDDGATSVITSQKSQEEFAGILVDYAFTNF